MSNAPRRRWFQFGLGTMFAAVTIAAVASWAWKVSLVGTLLAICIMEGIFASTYLLLRQAQQLDNRNSNHDQCNSSGKSGY